ncbi:MAG: glycosyltransferase [Candidatus Jacksonbacteria bacterium]|nr:glycosyltransferase [Candidatus Jacksonbacteria bacterium]
MKVMHIITDLDTGGAEMMLYKLLDSLQSDVLDSSVISLMGRGEITERIEALGVKVETLDLEQGARPSWQTIKKLRQIMLAFNPDIVQGWMYHGNIAATMAIFLHQPLHKKAKLFWNVRQTLYDINSEKIQTRWLIILGRWLSFFAHGIIYNSSLSAGQHCNAGYLSKKTKLIPNGFDLQKFRPDKNRRQQLREELGVAESVVLVGHISRLHPMKDHATLLRAIDRVVGSLSGGSGKQEVLFLLIGHDVTSELSKNPAIRFLGERADVPKIMSALDMVVSSSAWGEGFPNVIGEAMASEVPCVVTDVGDSAHIVGEYGRVCSVGDDQCIANSLLQLIKKKEERKAAGKQARQRIKNNYSMSMIKVEYLQEWGIK